LLNCVSCSEFGVHYRSCIVYSEFEIRCRNWVVCIELTFVAELCNLQRIWDLLPKLYCLQRICNSLPKLSCLQGICICCQSCDSLLKLYCLQWICDSLLELSYLRRISIRCRKRVGYNEVAFAAEIVAPATKYFSLPNCAAYSEPVFAVELCSLSNQVSLPIFIIGLLVRIESNVCNNFIVLWCKMWNTWMWTYELLK